MSLFVKSLTAKSCLISLSGLSREAFADALAYVKRLPKARYLPNTREWRVGTGRANCEDALREIIAQADARAAEAARARSEAAAARKAQARAALAGMIHVHSRYDDREKIKAMGGRWDAEKRVWAIPATPEAARAYLALYPSGLTNAEAFGARYAAEMDDNLDLMPGEWGSRPAWVSERLAKLAAEED